MMANIIWYPAKRRAGIVRGASGVPAMGNPAGVQISMFKNSGKVAGSPMTWPLVSPKASPKPKRNHIILVVPMEIIHCGNTNFSLAEQNFRFNK
jgi:hypothetical protein